MSGRFWQALLWVGAGVDGYRDWAGRVPLGSDDQPGQSGQGIAEDSLVRH